MKTQVDAIEYVPGGWRLAVGRGSPWTRRVQLKVPKRVAVWFARRRNRKATMSCCVIGCSNDAEFDIQGLPAHIDDNTQACTNHVGELLGTPDWRIGRSPVGLSTGETTEWLVREIETP